MEDKDLYCNKMMYSVCLLMLPVSAQKLGVLFLLFMSKHKFSCGIHASSFANMFYIHVLNVAQKFFVALTSGSYLVPVLLAILFIEP